VKKIYIITGTRAEYGLLFNLITKLNKDKHIDLKIIVTGMHLSSEYGNTFSEIINDGFDIYKRIKINVSNDKNHSISNSIGLGITKFAKLYQIDPPDMIVVLGDRYELLASVIPASIQQIPIFHIGGGDLTYGAQDDNIRHIISKLSWLHAAYNLESKKRIIQLGENPKRVFYCGNPGIERLESTKIKKKVDLEKIYKFKFKKKNILITYHSVTHNKESPKKDFLEILKAIQKLKDTKIIFTYPNSDANNKIIIKMINSFVKKNDNSIAIKSLGSHNYLSMLNYVDCIVGNSSSGILEAPSFKIATINIGDRQKGRIHAKSVINIESKENLILNSINATYLLSFKKMLIKLSNPHKSNNCSERIYQIIKKFDNPKNLKKQFYNI